MCVIVVKPAGVHLSRAVAARSYRANPHGFGLAWFEPAERDGRSANTWYYITGMTKKDMLKYISIYVRDDIIAVLHCRIASRGAIKMENNHPFPIPSLGGLLMHNGTMMVTPLSEKGTDTEAFALWLGCIDNLADLMLDPRWVKMLEELVEPSKMVIMHKDTDDKPMVTILNKKLGTEQDGLWASNFTAFREPIKVSKGWLQSCNDAAGVPTTTSYTLAKQYTPPPSYSHIHDASGLSVATTLKEATEDISEEIFAFEDRSAEAANRFEECNTLFEVEGEVRTHPHDAALALWYYRSLMGD